MKCKTSEYSQLRLLIDPQLVSQLDTLARSRQITRIALIRLFLRSKTTEELESLDSFLRQQERLKETKVRLDKYLDEYDL